MVENDKKKKVLNEEDPMDKYNVPLMQLATDISGAINRYLHSGPVNFAALIGILEDQKFNVSELIRKRLPADRVKFHENKEPASYIGL